jgi:hypothetical protein
MNEFGFDNLTAAKAPIVIYVASSTGDGDSPDNAAKWVPPVVYCFSSFLLLLILLRLLCAPLGWGRGARV